MIPSSHLLADLVQFTFFPCYLLHFAFILKKLLGNSNFRLQCRSVPLVTFLCFALLEVRSL